MKPLFIGYKKCSTCSKAKKYLKDHDVEYINREISEENPTAEELTQWIALSGLPIKKFFNTSGKVYRELNLKDKLNDMSDKEKIDILSTDGMLVKRPLLITDDEVLVGYKEIEYSKFVS